MPAVRPLAIALVLSLLAAGCLGAGKEDAEGPEVLDASGEGEVSSTGASTSITMPTANATETAAPPALAFSYSGSTPEGVCGPLGCNYVVQGSEDFHVIEHTGHPTSLTVTMTYADVKPGMEFYVGICLGSGESEADVTCRDYTTGASPLTVTFDLADHVPGTGVALSTGALNGASTATGLVVFTSSSFDASGTMSFAAHAS